MLFSVEASSAAPGFDEITNFVRLLAFELVYDFVFDILSFHGGFALAAAPARIFHHMNAQTVHHILDIGWQLDLDELCHLDVLDRENRQMARPISSSGRCAPCVRSGYTVGLASL